MTISFTINGKKMTIEAAPDRRVVDLIREELGLTGTKEGCGSGECGACTILVDGESRLACLMLAAQLAGRTVTTIEGLADGERLHPLQEAFVRCGAVQCGFCTPGMILAASALLAKKPDRTRDEVREGLSGNLCRCTGYQKIVDAVESASELISRSPLRGQRAKTEGVIPLKDRSFSAACRGELQSAARRMNPDIALSDAPETAGAPGPPPQQGCRGRDGDAPGTASRPGHAHTAGPAPRKVLLPQSLPELWSCLAEEPGARIFAGGTDLVVQMRAGQADPPVLVCLERIAALRGVREEAGRLWIGAGTTHSRLLDDLSIRRHLPVLARALETLGSPPIRSMGTIGGNICTASPAGDTLPPLYVLEAEVELIRAGASRIMPIASFITGPGQTELRKGEILAAIRLKKPMENALQHFEKVGQRKALACAVASMAALLRVSPTGVIEAVRIVWGSAGPTVMTVPGIETLLIGEKLTEEACAKAADAARSAVSPIDDLRGTADYRRRVSGNLLYRFLHSALMGS
ncbi:MAG: FAD binding domain-containing protein [Syntrophales bacterium]